VFRKSCNKKTLREGYRASRQFPIILPGSSQMTPQNLGFNMCNYRKYNRQEEKDEANKGPHAAYDAYSKFPWIEKKFDDVSRIFFLLIKDMVHIFYLWQDCHDRHENKSDYPEIPVLENEKHVISFRWLLIQVLLIVLFCQPDDHQRYRHRVVCN
jgi:hypothetical protein